MTCAVSLARLRAATVCLLLATSMVTSQVEGQESAVADEPQAAAQEPSRRAQRQGREQRRGLRERRFTDLLGKDYQQHWRGYKQAEWPQGWEVQDGVLHWHDSSGDLVTVAQYQDFDFRFEWKVSPGGNSGVMYHVGLGDPAPYFTGPEYQVLDDERHKDGKRAETSAGSLYALYAPEDGKVKPAGEWNKSRIMIRGNRVRHFLNGKKVVDVQVHDDDWKAKVAASKFASWDKFATLEKGHIALQDHGDEVWYRNVRIADLRQSLRGRGRRQESSPADSTSGDDQ